MGDWFKAMALAVPYSPGPVVRRPRKYREEEGGLGSLEESLALILDFGAYLWQGA